MLLQNEAKFGGVNVPDNGELGDRFKIPGFPTVMIFGADKRNPEEYNGPRDAKNMISSFRSIIEEEKKKMQG